MQIDPNTLKEKIKDYTTVVFHAIVSITFIIFTIEAMIKLLILTWNR